MIGCCCPACGDLSLKRQRIKRLIAELEMEHPDIKNSMIKALGHVVPEPSARHAAQSGARDGEPRISEPGTSEPEFVRSEFCSSTFHSSLHALRHSTRVARLGFRRRQHCRTDRRGLLVFVGVADGDEAADIDYTASKIRDLRIFGDDRGRMNRSVVEVGGGVLVISQFTLLADVRRGPAAGVRWRGGAADAAQSRLRAI